MSTPLDVTTVTPADLSAAVATLRARVAGAVLLPDSEGYAEEVASFNAATTHRPSVVVAARSTDDVAAAVRFAAGLGLPVAVQATGHGADDAITGGVLVSTKQLTGVAVDPRERTATLAAGTRWKAVIEAAAAHGLAPLNGSSSDVGAIGYTAGGGLPVLGRTFGFAADHVRRMTVVTADGEVREVSAETETDLFWGLRGGKGNLAIVTEMTVDLVPVSRLYGGGIFYAAEHTATVLHAYRDWAAALDESTTTAISLLRMPPIPEIPEPLRGRFVVHLCVAHVGSAADGERIVAPMRAAAPAIIDTLAEMPYTQVDRIFEDPDHPVPVYEHCVLLAELTDAAIAALLAAAGPDVSVPVMLLELRQLGGALSRPPAVANAVGARDAAFLVGVIGVLMPPVAQAVPAAVDAVVAAMAPYATGGTFVNFHGCAGDAADRARAWPAPVYERLRELKRRYDPTDVFCFGHAIRAADTASA